MTEPQIAPNGSVAAAVLSCGLGCFLLGILSVAAGGSTSLAAALTFYHPTGPLSGVTTVAIVFWLLFWALITVRWKNKTIAFSKISVVSFAFLGLGWLLTFPPIGDWLLGR